MDIAKVDLNLVVQYNIVIHTCNMYTYCRSFGICKVDCQTVKFNYPPIFTAIQYV